jgi:hypothetical protein
MFSHYTTHSLPLGCRTCGQPACTSWEETKRTLQVVLAMKSAFRPHEPAQRSSPTTTLLPITSLGTGESAGRTPVQRCRCTVELLTTRILDRPPRAVRRGIIAMSELFRAMRLLLRHRRVAADFGLNQSVCLINELVAVCCGIRFLCLKRTCIPFATIGEFLSPLSERTCFLSPLSDNSFRHFRHYRNALASFRRSAGAAYPRQQRQLPLPIIIYARIVSAPFCF